MALELSSGEGGGGGGSPNKVAMRFPIIDHARTQAGAALHFSKHRKFAFQRWHNASELPKPAAEWLRAQMPAWVKTLAQKEHGATFHEHIKETRRRVIIVNPEPSYEHATDIDLHPEHTRARRNHRALCWSMRQIASAPVDVKEVEAGKSAQFGVAMKLL